jgi:hypothetical protein
MKQSAVIYEPHPVTPERKAQLRAQGYTILDTVFAPAGYVHPDAKRDVASSETPDAQPRRGKK